MSITRKLDQIQRIPPEYLSDTPPPPMSVKIELVSRCNYQCNFCSIKDREQQPFSDMDWGLFVNISQEVANLGINEVGPFLIGEPFMNPILLHKAVVYLKAGLEIPYVFLTTNGSLAKPEYVDSLMSAGLDSLKWSVNYADWDQFRYFTNMPEKYFILAKRNIASAWKIRNEKEYSTKLYASSIKYNDEYEERIQPFLQRHVLPYVDEFYWLPLYSMGGSCQEITDLTRKGIVKYQVVRGNVGRIDSPVPPVPCWTLFTVAHIRYDGTMVACCSDSTGFSEVGDLKTQSFMDAWHSDAFKRLRTAHLEKNVVNTVCEKCIYG